MTDATSQPLCVTPLDALHRRLGAKMVPFAGYAMPLQYKGIIAEHQHTRQAVSLFDVSHMGQAQLTGDIGGFERLVVGDINGMAHGRMRYTLLTNEHGGIIDDLMVTHGGHYLWLVVNAARKAQDFDHLRRRLPADCELAVCSDRALLALQGPLAATVLARFAPAARLMLFMSSESLRIGDVKCEVSRSGYTGEDGFEISVPAEQVARLAELLLAEPEVKPAGLGARDTLRLEAGLCLYGQDLDETTTPIEAGLAWTIQKRRREAGDFPGAGVILSQLRQGPRRRRVGIQLGGRAPARGGAPVIDASGGEIGRVTSGSFGPSVGAPIALAYVNAECAAVDTPVGVIVRDKPLEGRVVKLPFVPHRYAH
ncbi:MAG: glycine cleavage system aminomethyltransferase GcvT [Rhodospirillales bacterium]|nr:glycine cleavage system aminomethyltransferase GcvT [Rhodospirillales bacterium]